MLAFLFGAARESEKLAKRVSQDCTKKTMEIVQADKILAMRILRSRFDLQKFLKYGILY